MNRTYPYKAWILMPSFKPVEVEFVKTYKTFTGNDYGDFTSTHKLCGLSEIFQTKEAAIEAGYARLKAIRQKIETLEIGHDKKRAALQKAAA